MKIQDFINIFLILEEFNAIKQTLSERIKADTDKIISGFIETKEKLKEENKKTSFLFNPLNFFNISETQHSLLLAKLLDPNGEHGQGDLFLKIFLEQINIKVNEKDKWIVTAETGRVDILIKRKEPHSVIIIENKSNYAIDQENQIYRYWLQEMFLPNDEKPVRFTLEDKNKLNYRLIYLSPDNKKIPHPDSLLKPNWEWLNKYENLPDKLEMDDIQILLFYDDIIKWLNKCLVHLENNHRLREFVEQYIELWK